MEETKKSLGEDCNAAEIAAINPQAAIDKVLELAPVGTKPEDTRHTVGRLPCKLTLTEHKSKAQILAAKYHDRQRIDSERKRNADHFKAKIQVIEGEIADLAGILATGTEDRDVRILEVFDFKRGIVDRYREDTAENLGQREIEPGERQTMIEARQKAQGSEEAEPEATEPEATEAKGAEEAQAAFDAEIAKAYDLINACDTIPELEAMAEATGWAAPVELETIRAGLKITPNKRTHTAKRLQDFKVQIKAIAEAFLAGQAAGPALEQAPIEHAQDKAAELGIKSMAGALEIADLARHAANMGWAEPAALAHFQTRQDLANSLEQRIHILASDGRLRADGSARKAGEDASDLQERTW